MKQRFRRYHPAPLLRLLRQRWPVRSAGVNFALAYGGIFLLSAGLFLSFTWWSTTRLLDHHVQAAIESDARDLARRWVFGGPPALSTAIEERIEQNIDDDALYLLVDPQEQRLAGNIPDWPYIIIHTATYYELPVRRYHSTTHAMLKAYNLPDGFRMIVGHDVRGRGLLRHIIMETLIWCALMILLLALGGAIVVRRLFHHVVHSIARTTAAVTRGDLTHRIPLNGSETDLVAETVNIMLERINRLMEGVRQVSNAIAHDLRTPITRARTRLEDAALHARSEQELRDAIDQAVLDLDHITGIFEALLRIAQIEAGARRAAFTPINVSHLLENMADFYSVSTEEAGLHLELDIAPLPTLTADAQMLQQAIANMLDNAIKFTPKGGNIILSARTVPADDTMPNGICISVQDQGTGMTDSDKARAHERFFRADTARNTPGSGLGLALVHAITNLHQGSFMLENTHPGLKVTLRLPLHSPT